MFCMFHKQSTGITPKARWASYRQIFVVDIKHWCPVEIAASRKLLNSLSTQTQSHRCVCSLHAHTHAARERTSRNAMDIYLSNPISPPPPVVQKQPVLVHLSKCNVQRREGGGGREKEMDGWRGVADVCWTAHSPWQKPDKAVVSQSEHR